MLGCDTLCKWLHESLDSQPLVKYPFELDMLLENGIYFFYEKDELWGHDKSARLRVVRVGTHRDGNFRSRVAQHFLPGDPEVELHADRLAPKDRSIFRKNLGRAILAKENPNYLPTWDIDFTTSKDRIKFGHLRNLRLESTIESRITRLLRENFSFRFIEVESQSERMGTSGLESRLIGTLANCNICSPSKTWLGNYSPLEKIRSSGLWQVQHINSNPITQIDIDLIQNSR